MRIKEIAPYLDPQHISQDMLQTVLTTFERSPPDEDRSQLIQIMYGVDDDLDLFGNGLGALGAGWDMDWDLDDFVTDPVEKEAKELENQLLRAKISGELAKAAKVRTEVQKIGAEADEAVAKAKSTLSYLSR